MLSGILTGTILSSEMTVYSECVPEAAKMTRCPALYLATALPTETTMPAPSEPGTPGVLDPGYFP